MFEAIHGQEHARRLLTRILESDRVPQALLFEGPEGVGKATLAGLVIAALTCTDERPGACGVCGSCRLHAAAAGHPDVTLVRRLTRKETKARDWRSQATVRAGEELSKDIGVDQIRELTKSAGRSPRNGRRRVYLIDPADRMNANAQNALLKTLEEPTPHTVVILVASRPRLLLPTVRSRCFSVRFSTLRAEELSRLLEAQGVEPAEARNRAALSEGQPGYAMKLDLDVLRERRDRLIGVLEKLAESPNAAAGLGDMARDLAGKDEKTLLESLHLLQTLLRDAGRAAIDPDDPCLVHADVRDRLAALGQRLTPRRAACW